MPLLLDRAERISLRGSGRGTANFGAVVRELRLALEAQKS